MDEQQRPRPSAADQWRACTRKRRFATRDAAEAGIVGLWLTGRGDGLKAYLCRMPGQDEHWHIGHLVPYWYRRVSEMAEIEDDEAGE